MAKDTGSADVDPSAFMGTVCSPANPTSFFLFFSNFYLGIVFRLSMTRVCLGSIAEPLGLVRHPFFFRLMIILVGRVFLWGGLHFGASF
jgi:hypothetical protein